MHIVDANTTVVQVSIEASSGKQVLVVVSAGIRTGSSHTQRWSRETTPKNNVSFFIPQQQVVVV